MSTPPQRTALVTGASRGIGRATAQALAKGGAHILVHYGNSAAEAFGGPRLSSSKAASSGSEFSFRN
jgi:NAD(P)-dependent dehydrogenase (short-subunit alcohol dehydrogenase family)